MQKQLDGSYVPFVVNGEYFGHTTDSYIGVLQTTERNNNLLNAGDFSVCSTWTTPDGIVVDNCPFGFNTDGYDVTWEPLYTGWLGSEKYYVNMQMNGIDWWLAGVEQGTTKLWAKVYKEGTDDFAWIPFEHVDGTVYEITVPAGEWDRFVIVRTNTSFDSTVTWNSANMFNFIEAFTDSDFNKQNNYLSSMTYNYGQDTNDISGYGDNEKVFVKEVKTEPYVVH